MRFLHKLRGGPITHPSFPSESIGDSGDFRKELMGHATSRFIPRRFSAFSRQNFRSWIHTWVRSLAFAPPALPATLWELRPDYDECTTWGAASGETEKASKLLRLVVPHCEMHIDTWLYRLPIPDRRDNKGIKKKKKKHQSPQGQRKQKGGLR